MAENKGSSWSKIIVIIVIICIILMFLIFFFVGFQGLAQFFRYLVIGLMVLLMIFGLLYVFYMIFLKKEYKDIPASYRKKIQATSKIMKQEMLGSLFLSGDNKHNRVNLGKYRYLRLMLPRQEKKLQLNKEGEPMVDKFDRPIYIEQTQAVPVDCFIVQNSGFIASMFEDPKMIVVKPQDHDYSAIFNDVTIKGFNLVPLDNQFYTVNHRNLDTDITKGLTTNYMKEVVHEILTDLDQLVKSTINLDAQFQKEKEKSLEFDIPSFGGGGDK